MRYSPSTEREEFLVGLRLFQDNVSRLLSEPSNRPWSLAVDVLAGILFQGEPGYSGT
jgi:hypothetical protein